MSKTMPTLEKGEKYRDKILNFYQKKGVDFNINYLELSGSGYKYHIKFKKRTEIEKMHRFAKNAQLYLKVERFEVVEDGVSVYIYLSEQLPNPKNWLKILSNKAYIEAYKHMGLIHPIGIDATGKLVTADLSKYPHALVAGASGSGKTCALKNLLINLIKLYTPRELNLIVGDKSYDLSMFSSAPHLSCPLIDDSETFLKVMLILHDEMERRIALKNTPEHDQMSRIVCVIDEFTSFISEMEMNDKKQSNLLIKTLNDILQRGRHASIHLILATHNPTKDSIKISTCNIPTRLVFRVANINNSMTVLGKRGAESLKGNGDMLFSMNGDIQRLQGIFITDEEIKEQTSDVKIRYWLISIKENSILSKPAFVITREALCQKEDKINEVPCPTAFSKDRQSGINSNDRLFAKVIIWALQQNSISANCISDTFKVGWRKAKDYVNKLQELNIVDDLNAKLPRNVLPKAIEDLSVEALNYLKYNGISDEEVLASISNRQ